MFKLTDMERGIISRAAGAISIKPTGPDTAAAIDRLERRGFLSRCGMCAWEITAKGERAYHHATGNGAAYDRMMRQ